MTVPYTFATATNTIPLSQLDSNFATAITLGNTAIQLGNTVTTLNNMTLANVTISSGNVTITNVSVTTANVTTLNAATVIATTGNITTVNATTVVATTANATTANITTGNLTDLNLTNNPTFSGGTANGVLYLNASKVATSGSALTFDGTTLYNSGNISVGGNSGGNRYVAILNETGTYTGTLMLQAGGGSAAYGGAVVMYGHSHASYPGAVYVGSSAGTSTGIIFGGGGNAGPATSEWMRLTSTGLGVGTSSPSYKLDVNGVTRLGAGTPAILAGVGGAFAGGQGELYTIGTNTMGIGTTGAAALRLYTNSVLQATLDSSGNLGIGTSSPSQKLHVRQDQAAYTWGRVDNQSSSASAYSGWMLGAFGNSWGIAIGSSAANSNALTFVLDAGGSNAEKMRLDTSGNLGIGTTSPSGKISVVETAGGSPAIRIQGDSSTNVGRLSFTDNGVTRTNALLTADNSGNLAFATNGTTERARIDSSGNLLVGTTTNSAKLSVEGAGSALYVYRTTAGGTAVFRNGDDAGYGIAFQNSSGGTAGSIYWTASATTYATSSDYRLKTLVGAVTGSGERIDALQPVEFDWKADGKRARGFFADKFQEVYPDSVSGEKDAVDAEGNPVYQSMQASTSEVIADLVAELQSLRKRVAQLEGK